MIELLLIGMFLGFVASFISYCYRKYFTPRQNSMNTYTFRLYRRIARYPATVIISAFNLQIECDDPFIERIRLAQSYPGWAIASEFASRIDEVYDEIFGENES